MRPPGFDSRPARTGLRSGLALPVLSIVEGSKPRRYSAKEGALESGCVEVCREARRFLADVCGSTFAHGSTYAHHPEPKSRDRADGSTYAHHAERESRHE
jgi:hypothetical protein